MQMENPATWYLSVLGSDLYSNVTGRPSRRVLCLRSDIVESFNLVSYVRVDHPLGVFRNGRKDECKK
jgi:hypothetical protein